MYRGAGPVDRAAACQQIGAEGQPALEETAGEQSRTVDLSSNSLLNLAGA